MASVTMEAKWDAMLEQMYHQMETLQQMVDELKALNVKSSKTVELEEYNAQKLSYMEIRTSQDVDMEAGL